LLLNIAGVYQISFSDNGRKYIGSASNLNDRKSEHLFHLKRNQHTNKHLQNAFNKHGEQKLMFDVVLVCDKQNRFLYEQMIIDYLTPERLYNKIYKVGDNPGHSTPEDVRKKISDGNKGKTVSDEVREKIRLGHLGMVTREATKRKLRNNRIGVLASVETKKKMSISQKLRFSRENATHYNSIPVEQYTVDMVFIKCYPSASQAGRETGASNECISRCCKGRIKTSGGFIWKFSSQ
jgi:group I intron endonuclease